MVKDLGIRLLAMVAGFFLMVAIVPGVSKLDAGGVIISALVYTALNATAGRILKFVTRPMALLTLGLSIIAVNLFVLVLTDWVVDGFDIEGFGSWVAATLILSVISLLANFVARRRR